MKCICDRSALQDALSAAASVALTRTPKPILECVRITAEQDGLTLMAYDLEVGIRCRVNQVEVAEGGETLVHCARLMSIVRESSDETMSLETQEDTLHIRGRDSHFQIVGQNVREFPPVPDMEGEPNLEIKVSSLRAAIEKSLFAAAKESTRYAINGVLWQREDNNLRLVATDGRRLAISAATLEKCTEDEIHAIVPAKALALFGRLHFDSDEILKARIMPNQIVMQARNATISSVLVEGNFPRWQDVVPQDNDKVFEFKTSTFLSAVKRAALLANMESKGVQMILGEGGVVFQSRSAEQGEAQVKLDMDCKGANMTIGFNPEFLIDALKVCDDQSTLALKDPGRPGLLKSGKNFEYVVMPVNLT